MPEEKNQTAKKVTENLPEVNSKASKNEDILTPTKEEAATDTIKIQEKPEELEESLVKKFPTDSKKAVIRNAIIVVLIILVGVASGYGLSTLGGTSAKLKSTEELETGIKVGDVFGLQDEKTFRDQAQGVVVKGGVDGEGSHHLIRVGGISQNVYLTSSTVDLDIFIDHQVKVWGETFSAQKAGWLMDVGRVEVIELNSEKPFEE